MWDTDFSSFRLRNAASFFVQTHLLRSSEAARGKFESPSAASLPKAQKEQSRKRSEPHVLAVARSRFGSDKPPACHSIPNRRPKVWYSKTLGLPLGYSPFGLITLGHEDPTPPPKAQKKKQSEDCFFFWLRGWDLNLMTSGL